MKKIKVLIADRLPIFACGLAHILSDDERIEVIDPVYTRHDVIGTTEKTHPDIIMIDAQLFSHDGVRLTEVLREVHPGIKFMVLTSFKNAKTHLDIMVNIQAEGFLLRTIKPGELVECVIEIAMGGTTISPKLVPLILEEISSVKYRKEEAVIPPLSIRELEVIERVAEGKSNRDIAEDLFISENTVKGHLRRISNKLNVNNRIEVARYMLLNGSQNHGTEELKKH